MTKSLLNQEWVDRLGNFTQLIIGFSGGLDSTVLLHLLASHSSLRKRLVAVHVNHGISKNAQYWQDCCAQFCLSSGIDFIAHSVNFDRSANIEARARTVRYDVFAKMLNNQNCLILGHHLDDQAETVLLQLFRGAGVDGLAAMTEVSYLNFGTVLRPLLVYSRDQLEDYATTNGLTWIEDESNQDIKYSRNYLRLQVMPLLKNRWPGIVANIARAATHCQQAKSNLDELALNDSANLLVTPSILLIEPLKALSFERITNVLRLWLKNNRTKLPSTSTFQRLIYEVIFASPDSMPIVSWGSVQVRRYQGQLYLDSNDEPHFPSVTDWSEFPAPLKLANAFSLSATKAKAGLIVPQDALVQIKFRAGGEQICWHGQSKLLKKLFQEWNLPPWRRNRVPLVYINNQLAAVVNYAVGDLFSSENQRNVSADSTERVYLIEETGSLTI